MTTPIYHPFPNCCRIQICTGQYAFSVAQTLYAQITAGGVLACINGIVFPMTYYPDPLSPTVSIPYWYGTATNNCEGFFWPGDGCGPPNVCTTCQLSFGNCQSTGLPNMNFLFQWVVNCPSGSSGNYGGSGLPYSYPPFQCEFVRNGPVEFCAEATPKGDATLTVIVSENYG